MTRNEMINTLRQFSVEVVFNKVDGTERKMTATLSTDIMPVIAEGTKPTESPIDYNSTGSRTPNLDVIRVWDLGIKKWRSFRVDSVVSFDLVKQ